jgi:dTMP kinase
MGKGKLITFEGCEGVGKSWQIRALKEYLIGINANFIITREPGGSLIAEKIREIILTAEHKEMDSVCEALLYGAARAQHIKDVISPALKEGKTVICDRYIDSTYAYQGFARGLGAEFVASLNALAVGNFIPDLTIFLDLPPEQAFERKGGADKTDRLENLDMDFHKKVYEGYKLLAQKEKGRFISIDASGSKADTHSKIIALLKERHIIG